MITLLIGTNRPSSRARRLSTIYAGLLDELGAPYQLLDLAELPPDFTSSALYHNAGKNSAFNVLADKMKIAGKIVVLVPEYNGSFPGVLKAFIDGLPYPSAFRGRKVALVGLSSGGQGGLLALSHLTDVLMYLGSAVLPQRVRLPFFDKEISDEGTLTNSFNLHLLREQAEALLAF